MRAAHATTRAAALRHVINYNTDEAADCLRLAQFADTEPSLPSAIAEGLRKLAAFHAAHATEAAQRLAQLERAA